MTDEWYRVGTRKTHTGPVVEPHQRLTYEWCEEANAKRKILESMASDMEAAVHLLKLKVDGYSEQLKRLKGMDRREGEYAGLLISFQRLEASVKESELALTEHSDELEELKAQMKRRMCLQVP